MDRGEQLSEQEWKKLDELEARKKEILTNWIDELNAKESLTDEEKLRMMQYQIELLKLELM